MGMCFIKGREENKNGREEEGGGKGYVERERERRGRVEGSRGVEERWGEESEKEIANDVSRYAQCGRLEYQRVCEDKCGGWLSAIIWDSREISSTHC